MHSMHLAPEIAESCDHIMDGLSVTDENGGGCHEWSFVKRGRMDSRGYRAVEA